MSVQTVAVSSSRVRSVCAAASMAALAALLATTAAFAQVSGVVIDYDLTRIPGARVSIQAGGPVTTADANGAFTLPDAHGSALVVVAAHPGYFNASATVNAPSPHVVIALAKVPQDDDPSYTLATPESCRTCHPDQYSQWLGSPMSRAGVNDWVHDVYDGSATPGGMGGFVYLRDSMFAATNPASECASCHQPQSWIESAFTPMLPPSAGTPGVLHGVSCDVCHKIAHIDETKINAPGIYPGVVTFTRPAGPAHAQVQYGVLGDVDFAIPDAMRASYQPQLVAEVCGACHQDKNDPDQDGDFNEPNGVVSEPTYLEWAASPYGDPGSPRYATCVDCHMAPAASERVCSVLDLGRDPATIRSHRIEGTTADYLENAADLALVAGRVGDAIEIDASVTNSRTGHHLPSGVTIRNVILAVDAWREEDGVPLASTGAQTIHPLGGVGDPAQGYLAGLPGKLFAFVNHDPAGNAPTFFTDAAGVLFDTRIPALATDTTHYRFALPAGGGTIRLRARLIYRRSFRALVDAKQWTMDGHGRPLADVAPPDYGHLMEEAERTVPAISCDGMPAGASCDDGNACNGAERCDGAGGCVSGTPLACGDGDPCTDDACDVDLGCTHAPNAAQCDDGDACTTSDVCADGVCAGVSACDDGNPCTDDHCGVAGCVHVPNTASCDDHDACTTGDVCADATCVGTGTLACDDEDPCTADGCVPADGCWHAAAPRPSCMPATLAEVRLRDRVPDKGDQIQWTWRNAAASTPAAFGTPDVATSYVLCLFDHRGGSPVASASLGIPAGARWRSDARGWKYRDQSAAADGIRSVAFAAGPWGAKIQVNAKGAGVPMPVPRQAFRFFDVEPMLTVQLLGSDDTCWESTFPLGTSDANSAARFAAKLP